MQLLRISLALLIGLAALATQSKGQSDSSNVDWGSSFVLSRMEKPRHVTCVSQLIAQSSKYTLPSYNLDKLKVPEGGFSWKWSDEWTLKNLQPQWHQKYVPYENRTHYVFTDGGSDFYFLSLNGDTSINLISSNVSLWFPKKGGKEGTLVQMDHRNETTGEKFTRVMHCDQIPKDKQEEDHKCYELWLEEGTNFLNDGYEWTILRMSNVKFFAQRRNTLAALEKCKMYIRSHRSPGVFTHKYGPQLVPLSNDNQMSKIITLETTGQLCFQVEVYTFSPSAIAHYQLLNLDENRVETSGRLTKQQNDYHYLGRIETEQLRAGEYRLTLTNISATIALVKPCPGAHIEKSFMPRSLAPHYCTEVGYENFETNGLRLARVVTRPLLTSGFANATLKTGWDMDEWAYACDQLGVAPNQTKRVRVKFCNLKDGCNFAKCPHRRRDEQQPLIAFIKPTAKDDCPDD